MWTLFRWQSLVDYITVTLFLYALLHLAREARALRTAFVVVALYAGALLSRNFDLITTSWVLDRAPGLTRRTGRLRYQRDRLFDSVAYVLKPLRLFPDDVSERMKHRHGCVSL